MAVRAGRMERVMVRALLKMLVGVMFRVRLRGELSAVREGRQLIVANHESFLDGLLLGLFLPVHAVFVVHTSVAANPLFRAFLRYVDYLAVDPTSPMAMKKVVKLLEAGRPVVIFPEGRITVTGSLMKVYEGPAFVAARTGASIVPVRLDGPARSYFSRLSGQYPRRLFPRVSITVLPSTHISMPDVSPARERRRMAGEQLRRIMQEMLFASQPVQTLFSALIDAISIFGRRRKLLEDLRQIEYSYGDLLKMVLVIGRLLARETRAGERVGVVLPNSAACLATVIGATAYGRVPAMLNYTAGLDGMRAACTAAEINTVLSSRQFVEAAKLGGVLGSLGRRIIYIEDLREGLGLGDKLWLVCFALWLPRWIERRSNPEAPAVVLFTSGSEGKPKGVVLPHRALLSNIAQIRSVIDFSSDDKFLSALPMFHSFGLTAGSLLPVLTGTRLFLYPTPLHYRIIPEVFYDRNCTVLFGTSTFLANYARFAHPYDFYRLRYVVAGAEKLSESVRSLWFEKFGVRILEGYGATETSPVMAVNTPLAYRSGSVGQLLPGMEARIAPVPGIEQGGMLHVRGPNLMAGYLKVDRPGVLELPSSEQGAGWYNTGDVVEFDADGFMFIRGRAKRFAKVAGEMVSLEAVELLASAASSQGRHAAVNIPDAQRGESIVLFTTDHQLTRECLLTTAREQGVPEIAVPRILRPLTELPLLGTGKIDYPGLMALAKQ